MTNKANIIHFVHFRSRGRDYILELSYVKEIIRMVSLTRVAELPPFVRGIINLRGESLPVVDFVNRAGGDETEITLRSRIMVMRVAKTMFGLLVDDVLETLALEKGQLSTNIQSDVVIDPKYIAGTFYLNDQLLIWVDVMKLFSSAEVRQMEAAASE